MCVSFFCCLENYRMKLFVGNLSWDADEEGLKTLFEQFGKVKSVKIVTDQGSGRSKGFGFVEMEDEAAGNEAVKQLNETPFLNRPLRVSPARQEQGPRPGGGGGGRPSFGSRGRQEGSFRRPYREFRGDSNE
jgi:RNA recognition motif-containing protein